MNSTMKRKLAGLFVAVVLALVGLSIRITYINASSGEQYSKQVLAQSQQQYGSTTLPFKRGDILDANGTVLATSEQVYNLILDCNVVNARETYREPTVTALVELLGQDRATIEGLLDAEETKSSQYQVLARGLSIIEKKEFEDYVNNVAEEELTKDEAMRRARIQGVWFEENYQRNYPLNSMACDVLGFTYSGNSADWGLEGYYNNILNGVNGRRYGYFNEDSEVEQTIIQPVNGNSIVTTIDSNIQQIVERYITQYEEEMSGGPYGTTGARNVGVIIMDPNNGAVLAMGSNNPFDLNNPRDLTSFYTAEEISAMSDEQRLENLNSIWKNYCISESFEPGSTVKPLTVAAALEDATLNGSESFYCDGGQTIAGTFIKCDNRDGHGDETLSDAIRNSCNDVLMQISSSMGVEEFIKYQNVFNFGRKTGIDLSGEASGILHTTDTMGSVELATSSFGQGFTCTMIQEIAAMASIINGGNYYQPQLVSQIVDENGSTVENIEPLLLKQTVSSEVSALVRSYMQASVENGTSRNSKVDGYSSGGKTGTAQKIPRGNGKYLVSFIGFTPADNPEVLIYVVVDEPNTEAQADSAYAQNIARRIMKEVLPYMNIYPDEETTGINPDETYTPDQDTDDTDSDDDSDDGSAGEGTVDVNVPEPAGQEGEVEGGNTRQSDGLTNDEAGFAD